jgi:hypothetical protein
VKIPLISFARAHPVISLLAAGTLFGAYALLRPQFRADDRLPVSVIGVQHLGPDYEISEFYVNRHYFSNVGQGGGGGGEVCCVTLPIKWHPGLKAEVRWEAAHIIKRSADPAGADTGELVGMYRAHVPVEAYAGPGDLYVHFYPEGRVRIVVSSISPSGERHPIQWGDAKASQMATTGTVVEALFTSEELAELEREDARRKAKYGDWR